jgi:hypothetical protein
LAALIAILPLLWILACMLLLHSIFLIDLQQPPGSGALWCLVMLDWAAMLLSTVKVRI